MRIGGWRGKTRRRDEWKSVLREVKFFKDRSAIGYMYSIMTFFDYACSSKWDLKIVMNNEVSRSGST
jgi:hypothetical protein